MTPRQPALAGARCQAGRAPARTMVSELERKGAYASHPPPLYTVRHRDRTRGRVRLRALLRAAGTGLRPRRRRAARRPASGSPQGPPSLWRYAPLLPVAPPEPALLAPGFTPLVAAPRLAAELGVGELYLKLDTANPTHSFKDRVVAVATAKAQELGLEALACASTGNLANAVAARAAVEGMPAAIFCPADVEREKLLASAAHGATIYAVRGNYDACSRLTIELSFELPWAFVNVDAPRLLRRGLEDARVRGRRAARVGAARRGRRPGRLGLAPPAHRAGLRGLPLARARRTGRRRG